MSFIHYDDVNVKSATVTVMYEAILLHDHKLLAGLHEEECTRVLDPRIKQLHWQISQKMDEAATTKTAIKDESSRPLNSCTIQQL